MSTHHISV